MNKVFTKFSGLLFLVLAAGLQGQEIKINMNVPTSVNAGSEFEIRLTIDKGNLTDYSRFSQELPLGLTAVNVMSPNADFSFEDQRIRIIWLKLPDEQIVNVVYRVTVDERLKGTFTLDGTFAYVVEEERKYADVTPSGPITINPNSMIDQSMIVDIKDFRSVMEGTSPAAAGEVFAMAIRQKPILLGNGEVLVNLLIKNPSGSKYAKIEETIPSGYLFEEVDTHRGIVSFESSLVKFIWMKLPPEPQFMISYKLVPKAGERQGELSIKGEFSYTSGNDNLVSPVKEMDANLEAMTDFEREEILLSGNIPEGASTSTMAAGTPVKTEETVKTTKTTVQQPPSGTGNIRGTEYLQPGSGIYYRIQLIAVHTPFDANTYYSRKGIDKEVKVEKLNGWYKYSVGSFSSYSEANTYKNSTVYRAYIPGAFIVAYRDGNRINIKSALSQTN